MAHVRGDAAAARARAAASPPRWGGQWVLPPPLGPLPRASMKRAPLPGPSPVLVAPEAAGRTAELSQAGARGAAAPTTPFSVWDVGCDRSPALGCLEDVVRPLPRWPAAFKTIWRRSGGVLALQWLPMTVVVATGARPGPQEAKGRPRREKRAAARTALTVLFNVPCDCTGTSYHHHLPAAAPQPRPSAPQSRRATAPRSTGGPSCSSARVAPV